MFSLVALVFLSNIIFAHATDEAVRKYDTVLFNKEVPQRNHYVLFYAPWSSEYKSMSPIWEEMGQNHNKRPQSDVVIAKVDCTKESKLCSHQDVSDYPTIKFYKTGGPELGVRYRGVKDLHSLEQFLNFQIDRGAEFIYGARVKTIPEKEQGLHPLQDENFFDVVQNGHAVINFCTPWSSRCMDLEPVWKQIGKEFQFQEDLIVGQVDCTMSKTTCNENEVRGYPSILWLTDGIVVEKYPSKDREFEPLKKYILNKLGKKEATKVTGPRYDEDPDLGSTVVKLEKENFYDVVNSGNVTFVHFWTPWCSDCMSLEVTWEALADYFQGSDLPVVIGKVDCTLQKTFCEELEVEEFPTINVYRDGALEHIYAGVRKLDDLIDFVTLAAKAKKPVEEL